MKQCCLSVTLFTAQADLIATCTVQLQNLKTLVWN